MNTNIPSNATVKAFDNGYKLVNAIADTTNKATGNIVDTAVEAKHITGGFFSGMRYAIRERRGHEPKIEIPNEKEAKRQASLAAARELYERAHGRLVAQP